MMAQGKWYTILFGLFAKGSAGDKSDVDLLVDSSLRGLQFVGLIKGVRTAIGREVDLFDVKHTVRGSPIDQEIAKTGVTIYEKCMIIKKWFFILIKY